MIGLLRRLSAVLAPGRSAVHPGATGPGGRLESSDRDGSVAIRAGEVQVVEPSGVGRWPVIQPGPMVQVWVDGESIVGPTLLQAGQEIALVTPAPPRLREIYVTVAADRMTASLHLGPGTAIGWQVRNMPPAPLLVPEADPRPVTLADSGLDAVLALLARQRVTHGIETAAVAQALAAPEAGVTVVAHGALPVPPDPGRVVLRIPEPQDGHPITVEPGTVLAICNPPQPGVPGYDVAGTPIPPPAATPIRLTLGHGVGMSPNQQQVVALATGVPEVHTTADSVRLTIRPLFMHRGSLGHGHGPLEFAGDIWVDGWAELGAVIRAGGSVFISRGAQGVEVVAGQEVHVASGCIRSVIRQGEARAQSRSLQPDTRELARHLADLRQTVHLALTHPRYSQAAGRSGVGPLVQLLVQNRFGRLAELHRILVTRAAKHARTATFQDGVLEPVARVVSGNLRDLEDLDSVLQAVSDWLAHLEDETSLPAGRVEVYHLLCSQVYAAGAVDVTGPGVEQSEIIAGGPVRVTGQVRGGRIQSEATVHLGRVGAPVGMQTVVAVPADAAIHAEHIYPGTICEVGSRSHRLINEARYVIIRLNTEGQIALAYG